MAAVVRPLLLHQLLEAAGDARGEAVAVIDGDRSITYGELNRRSNQVARLLLELGVSRCEPVGTYLDKSPEAVIALYGILKAGAAYVPLDPQSPPARLAYMARNCAIRYLITGTEKQERWAALVENGAPLEVLVVLNYSGEELPCPAGIRVLDGAAVDAQGTTAPSTETISLDLAYILYTSGSTGNPKGVMLSHLNAMTFVEWAANEFRVSANDRIASHAPFHFDLSVFDLFVTAAAGASLVLVPSGASVFPVELRRFLAAARVTISYSVPSLLTRLTLRGGLAGGDLSDLRLVLFAGEVFPVKYLQRLMELLPGALFANLYGPTETNVCMWWPVPPLESGRVDPVLIGRPIADVEAFAVTEEGRRAAGGEIGELYVRGSSVTKGYWGDSSTTARALVPDPFRPVSSERVYRTGDFVQHLDDGNYKFLGRRDAQIKSGGYRIELSEIEASLDMHPKVFECAVIAVPDKLVSNRIKAFVVGAGVDARGLVEFCSRRLPQYMIPDTFEFCQALPRTSTGKVDRQALMKTISQAVPEGD